ncbi:MAG: amidohydrolase family protein [Planctomycetota bacterium]|nr:amidohydrolase family protein [Planctomycetota bacterium]
MSCLAVSLPAEEPSAVTERGNVAVVGGRVHPVSGDVIPDGTVIIRQGKIAEVGERSNVTLPPGIPVIDATGLEVVPGFVELESRLFVEPSALRSFRGGAADRSVAEALTPFEDSWEVVRDEGVTTIAVSLGAAGGAGGLGAVLKLRHEEPAAPGEFPFLLKKDSHFVMALGVSGSSSTSAQRLQQYYQLRSLFVGARTYRERWDAYWKAVGEYNKKLADYLKKKKAAEAAKKTPPAPKPKPKPKPTPKPPNVGPKPTPTPAKAPAKPPELKPPARPKRPAVERGKAALLRAMAGKLPVLVAAHRADDVEYARRLKEEFGLEMTVVGGTAARELAKELAAAEVPVALEPVIQRTRALEYEAHSEESARLLQEAGVRVAIASSLRGSTLLSTSRSGRRSRLQREVLGAGKALRLEACATVRGGLTPALALRGITLEPARILGVDDRVGALEKGKDGDLVLLDGSPMDGRSRVVQVVVDGIPGERRALTAARWRSAPQPAGGPKRVDAPQGAGRVLRGVTVVTPRGKDVRIIENASVVIHRGKVLAIAPASAETPEDLEVHDLPGRWVLPGFIDAHSHLALDGETDDLSSAVLEDLRVEDAFDPWADELKELLAQGVTAVALSPGQGNVVGGRINLVKLVPGKLPLRTLASSDRGVAIKASLNPRFTRARFPASLSGAAQRLESWLREKGEELSVKPQPVTAVVVQVEWRGQAERILESFSASGLRPVFLEGLSPDSRTWEGLQGAAPVILRPYSLGEDALSLRSASVLEKKGVPFAFSTSYTRSDYPYYRTVTRRDLLTSAILAVHHGLSLEGALRALTASAAGIYGLDGRLGVVENGADADLVVWNGDPFSLNAAVEMVFIDGELVFRREVRPPPPGVASLLGPLPGPEGGDVTVELTSAGSATNRSAISARPAAGVILVRARRLYPVSGPVIEDGRVVVREGKIVEVGKSVSVDESTPGVEVLDVDGSVVPGFVDAGSSLAVVGPPADEFRELAPAHRVADALSFDGEDLRRALESGVTTAAVTPGARNVIGGLGGVIKTGARSRREGLLRDAAFLCVSLVPEAHSGNAGLRFGSPRTYNYRIPTTRMGTVFLVRRAFFEAQQGGFEASPPESGLREMLNDRERRVLKRVLAKELPVRFRADTRAEILTALRIADEFHIPLEIEGGREALRLIDRLRGRKVTLYLEADARWGREIRSNPNLSARLPAELEAAGVPFAFFSRRAVEVARLRERVTWTVRHGLSEEAALRAITGTPARLLGIGERVGSLEVGKDADLVAIDGEPFSSSAPVLWVMSQGRLHRPSGRGEAAGAKTLEGAAKSDPGAKRRIFAPRTDRRQKQNTRKL